MVERLSAQQSQDWARRRWRGFQLPMTERVDVPKARLSGDRLEECDWGPLALHRLGRCDNRVGDDGVASGTPMQVGGSLRRTMWWGRPLRLEKKRAAIPYPSDGGLHWTTGYPVTMFDRRCIITDPDGAVHEMLHLNPRFGATRSWPWPGFAQDAYTWGRWVDGELVDGVATTAAGIPLHQYIWGPGSAQLCHTLALVLGDYQGGDGTLKAGPRLGDHVVLDIDSRSAQAMFDVGGECASMALALCNQHGGGALVMDRSGYDDQRRVRLPKLHIQAGDWTRYTNLDLFSVALADFRRVA